MSTNIDKDITDYYYEFSEELSLSPIMSFDDNKVNVRLDTIATLESSSKQKSILEENVEVLLKENSSPFPLHVLELFPLFQIERLLIQLKSSSSSSILSNE